MKAPVSVAGMLSCSVSIAQVSNAYHKSSIYLPSSVELGYLTCVLTNVARSMHNKNTHEEWHTVIIFSSQTMNTLKLVTLRL